MKANESDLIVIGAGPAGLAFAKNMADSGLTVRVLEQQSQATLANPPADGREIALTHRSKAMLQDLGAWSAIAPQDKYFLRSAKVLNGDSPYTLDFNAPKQVETLGYLVSNHLIRKALFSVCRELPNIEFMPETQVESVAQGADDMCVTLASGTVLRSRLVVAADSRFSQSRRQMGISADWRDFGRTVIVFRFEHRLSNFETAYECFQYGRTLAILPLGTHQASAVITIDNAHAESIWQMDEAATRYDLQQALEGRLGEIIRVGEKHRYPLIGVHASRFWAKGFALIGDAAVGMHPVTAHGFNLGLESQALLASLIKKAHSAHLDFAADSLLKTYSKTHMRHTLPLYLGTNAIVGLFTDERLPARALRHAALHAGDWFLPFKRLITKQLTG